MHAGEFNETRHLHHVRNQIEAMDPSFKDYFEKLSLSLDEIRSNLPINMAAVKSQTAKFDDLVK